MPAPRPLKWDPDLGRHPEGEVDVQAVVVRWDQSLKTLVVDSGAIHPAVALTWLRYAVDRVEAQVDELYCDPILEGE